MSKFYDHKIKYRSFDQLINSVADDWRNYDANNLIDPSQLIKTVRKINKQLGLRVTRTKETIVDFDNWIVNLPDDMENLNFAVICGRYTSTFEIPQGVVTENVSVDCSNGCTNVFITPFGDTYQVVQRAPTLGSVSYEIVKRVHIHHSSYQSQGNNEVTGVFLNDNFMRMNLKGGKIYLNYEGMMEDDEGNLLVVDHPLINDYYEYSIKERLLENMYFNGEDVERKLGFIQSKLQMSKRDAYNVANMPEFKELQEIYELNRQAMYKKYFSIFA